MQTCNETSKNKPHMKYAFPEALSPMKSDLCWSPKPFVLHSLIFAKPLSSTNSAGTLKNPYTLKHKQQQKTTKNYKMKQ
jgi:hypothetical protein